MKISAVTLATLCLLALPTMAQAARPDATSSKSQPTANTSGTGNDVSYPQCGTTLPTGHAFGIVGVNGGIANNPNTCFGSEYTWAQKSTGTTNQAPVQLYVNTGNPGSVVVQAGVTDWPYSDVVPDVGITTNNPYTGGCTYAGTIITPTGQAQYGPDNQACSWQYGFNKAYSDFQQVAAATSTTTADGLMWWFDVETGNSWDSGVSGQQNNVAVLEGMEAAFEQMGVPGGTFGAYSTNAQWNTIFGTQITSASPLHMLSNWQAGAKNLRAAESSCSNTKFAGTTGPVSLTQYTTTVDIDYSCIH